MSSLFLSIGAVGPNWTQRHLPWLGVLALLFGLSRDDDEGDAGSDDLHG